MIWTKAICRPLINKNCTNDQELKLLDAPIKALHIEEQQSKKQCTEKQIIITAESWKGLFQSSSWLQSLVQLSYEVRTRAPPNAFSAQHPVHSDFNLSVWSQYLEHYEDRIVVDFLHFGWPINFHSDVLPFPTFRNHPSAISKSDCPHISPKNLPISQCLVHFIAILLISTVSFNRLCACPSATLLTCV